MNVVLMLPILIPFITAIVMLLFWSQVTVQRWLNVIGAVGLFGAGHVLLRAVWLDGVQATQLGGWGAPFSITIVADLLAAIMVVLAGLVGLVVAIYSLASIDPDREAYGYYPLLFILLMGICGSFMTGDIFNLYVWFEVLLIASFVLLSLGGERIQLEGAVKYVVLNLLSSALFLTAVGLLYGTVGTLNMADLAGQVAASEQKGMLTTISMLFLVAFGIKAAIFPVFAWLPVAYPAPPIPISAIFAGLLTKVGVYVLFRVFTLIFVHDTDYTHTVILYIAGLTMIFGILGALAQTDVRHILSFNLISHIGFMLMGLGLFTPLALAGAIFYLIHDVIVKTNLFLVSGLIKRLRGTEHLAQLGGLYKYNPGLAVLFLIPAFALSGVPPLSGFWPKLALIQAGLSQEQYLVVCVALITSLLTLYSMTQIWAEAFWRKEADASGETASFALPLLGPIIVLTILSVSLGLFANPILTLTNRAAEQLIEPSDYIHTVLPELLSEVQEVHDE